MERRVGRAGGERLIARVDGRVELAGAAEATGGGQRGFPSGLGLTGRGGVLDSGHGRGRVERRGWRWRLRPDRSGQSSLRPLDGVRDRRRGGTCREVSAGGIRVDSVDHRLERGPSIAGLGQIKRHQEEVEGFAATTGPIHGRREPIDRLGGTDAITEPDECVDATAQRRLIGRAVERAVEGRQRLGRLA